MADAQSNKITRGDVIWLRSGLHVWHWQAKQMTSILREVTAVVLAVRNQIEPSGTHSVMIDVRVLNSRSQNYGEGAKLTFAYSGPFRPEFIMHDVRILRRLPKPK